MIRKVIHPTSKGQITLPKEWRDQFSTDNFLLTVSEHKIEIVPLYVDELHDEEILFDAARDNAGKGVSVAEMITHLKKIKKHG